MYVLNSWRLKSPGPNGEICTVFTTLENHQAIFCRRKSTFVEKDIPLNIDAGTQL